MTWTIWRRMIEKCVIVDMLFAVDQHQAIERRFCAVAAEHHIEIVARELPAQRGRLGDERPATSNLRLRGGDMERLARFMLETAMIDARVVAGHHFSDGVGEVN